jgi:hypothetical protein
VRPAYVFTSLVVPRGRTLTASAVLAFVAIGTTGCLLSPAPTRVLSLTDARVQDGIKGGWVGQIVGGAWGAPTEFRFTGKTIPAGGVPRWSMRHTNRYTFATPGGPDETYVEIPFLDALAQDPLAGWPEWGRAFASSHFRLFSANLAARKNLRAGIEPPVSGDPANNPFASDIDFQIESNFAGLVAPGQPAAAIDIAWRAGHVVGYSDGVYGGAMVAAMQAEAFRAQSVDEIVEAGRQAVPLGSDYRSMIEDVIRWHAAFPDSWRRVWRLLETRWNAHNPVVKRDPGYVNREFNIDAKLNGAYVLLGLLYGNGSFARTIRIAMRAGQDSDCNPNDAGGIIGAWWGFSRIPQRFTRGLTYGKRFPGTTYTLANALQATTSAAQRVTAIGGGNSGPGGWSIPESAPLTPIVERWPMRGAVPPRVHAAATPTGRMVQFEASGQATTRYWWSFGDLSDGEGASPVHTYRQPGVYRAIVWGADARGRTETSTVTVDLR